MGHKFIARDERWTIAISLQKAQSKIVCFTPRLLQSSLDRSRTVLVVKVTSPEGLFSGRGSFAKSNQFAALCMRFLSARGSSRRHCAHRSGTESGRPASTRAKSDTRVSGTRFPRSGASYYSRTRSCTGRCERGFVPGAGICVPAAASKGWRRHVRDAEAGE